MTLKDFYETCDVAFNNLANFIKYYENNEIVKSVINSEKEIDKITTMVNSFATKIVIKHLLLIAFISIIFALPFKLISFNSFISVLIFTFVLLIIASIIVNKNLEKLSTKYSRFDKYAEDIKTANIDGIRENKTLNEQLISKVNNVCTNNNFILNFIDRYYYNGHFADFWNSFKDLNYYADIYGKQAIINSMFLDIQKTCGDIYKNLTKPDDEHEFLEKIIKKFDDDFMNTVYDKTTFCDDFKFNKFLVLNECRKDLLEFDDGNKYSTTLHLSFESLKDQLKESGVKDPEITYNMYGYIGLQIVETLIVIHGLDLMNKQEELMKA